MEIILIMVRRTGQFRTCKTIPVTNRCSLGIWFATPATTEQGIRKERKRGERGKGRRWKGRLWPSKAAKTSKAPWSSTSKIRKRKRERERKGGRGKWLRGRRAMENLPHGRGFRTGRAWKPHRPFKDLHDPLVATASICASLPLSLRLPPLSLTLFFFLVLVSVSIQA